MSTPAYLPPNVGPAGLTVPQYPAIQGDNLAGFLNIYGPNQYATIDSAIYQLLSILSLKLADSNNGLQLLYNQTSPATAVGAGLDRLGKLIGVTRLAYTYSTALLTVAGTPSTIITNGIAQDVNGYQWSLPASVTIPTGGSVNVTGTCTTPGAIVAEPGQVSIIATPQAGWLSVTNAAAAVTGNAVESDSQYRARMAISVALPSQTRLAGTIAALEAVTGVTRVGQGIPTPSGVGSSAENPSGATDSWGNPAHSISMVVENGANADIAMAIYTNRGIGCFTNGNTSVVVTDPSTGYQMTISFFRPTYVPIYVTCAIHGYSGTPTTAVVAAVQTAIVNYLNSLSIGETVPISAVNYIAMSVNQSLNVPTFGVQSLTIGTSSETLGTSDVAMPNFYSVAQGIAANVIVSTE